MHTTFNLQLKAQGGHEDFLEEEIDTFLNRATRLFIEDKKPTVIGSPLALSDLRTLLRGDVLNGGDLVPHGQFANVIKANLTQLGDEFEYAIGGRGKISSEEAWKVLTLYGYPEFIDRVSGEAHSPVYRSLPATIENTSLLVLADDDDGAVTDVHVAYLKTPDVVSFGVTDSDLPPHTHQEIVSRAVVLALQAIGQTEA